MKVRPEGASPTLSALLIGGLLSRLPLPFPLLPFPPVLPSIVLGTFCELSLLLSRPFVGLHNTISMVWLEKLRLRRCKYLSHNTELSEVILYYAMLLSQQGIRFKAKDRPASRN